MSIPVQHLRNELQKKGIRPSYQRIKVLEYLQEADSHPTVDEIYRALSPEIPSLSKATIYNTLHTFTEAGLARVISIDDVEMHYDSILVDHGHFKCESCGAIVNFAIDIEHIAIGGLKHFKVTEKNVYFKGLCPDCVVQPEKRSKQ